MERRVILVDVGYLLAEGGKAYCGVPRRSLVRCDYDHTADALERFSEEHTGLPLLRSYWYDGAPDHVPTPDHLVIAGLPRVKLRLGRLVQQRRGTTQKGVDSLIVHDMITLAHERALSAIYLLAGDEDLREGVAAAQRLGVQVFLLGIPGKRPNQSLPLIREADEHLELEPDVLRPFFHPAGFRPGATGPFSVQAQSDPAGAITAFAKDFAARWIEQAETAQAAELLAHEPRIPQALDVQLLVSAEEALGLSLREDQELRHLLRAAFWHEVKSRAGAETP